MVFREGVLEIRTSFFKGLSNLGHFRTSRKEGVENGQKIRTSFMDGPKVGYKVEISNAIIFILVSLFSVL